jgi:hypothetical protein
MSEVNTLAARAAELAKRITGVTPEKVRVAYDTARKVWCATVGVTNSSAPHPEDALRGLVHLLEKEAGILASGLQEKVNALRA